MTRCSNWRLAVVLLAAVLLLPWQARPPNKQQQLQPVGIQTAAAQGLAVSSEQLGAGEAATATQLEYFEDSLTIAATGGRGRGGRGGSASLGASAFTDVDQLQQMQRGIYYIAAAPKIFPSCQYKYSWRKRRAHDTALRADCNNFVPSTARDQKACATCVSQSVATAMQMAAAAALEADVDAWEVNAPTLYYCTEGGRSCSTGYNIQDNLHDVIDKAPELIRPSTCAKTGPALSLTNPTIEPSVNSWIPACDQAKQDCITNATHEQPFLNCTYKSMSTFWEIQQWIRNHGAVVTRITIYDDFTVQINKTAKSFFGEEWPAYRFNKTAKPLYGHAAVIVGYDNENFTWTLLNSWGFGKDTNNTRDKGLTADGLFKIQMGLAGVGTPDQTYGVACAPLPGSKADFDGVRYFYNYKRRMPVEFINPKKDRLDPNVACFKYKLRLNDSVASVVDAFNLTMEDFVLKQMEVRRQHLLRRFSGRISAAAAAAAAADGDAWGFENVTYKLAGMYDVEVFDKMLRVATNIFQVQNKAPYTPYLQCWHFDSDGNQRNTTCNAETGASVCLRYGNGTVGCALHYANIFVPQTLTGRNNNTVVVCNIKHPYFANPRDSQPRALARLGLLDKDIDYCYRKKDCGMSPTRRIGCNNRNYTTYVWNTPTKFLEGGTKYGCFAGGNAPDSLHEVFHSDLDNPISIEEFDPPTIDAFLQLKALQAANIHVNKGVLPLQLAGLHDMKHLLITYNRMTGSLPEAWHWKNMSTLLIGSISDPDSPLQTALQQGCGIIGTLPAAWPQKLPRLKLLYLANNQLGGGLLELNTTVEWTALSVVWLGQNKLSGKIPESYAGLRLRRLWLGSNSLSGSLPAFSAGAHASSLQSTLTSMDLSNNFLTGSLPITWSRFSVLETLDLSHNQLEGQVPLSWSDLEELATLELGNNAKLAGCIPVPRQQKHKLNAVTEGTNIYGMCSTQRLEVEQQQRKALDLLPAVFYTDTAFDATSWQAAVNSTLLASPSLANFYAGMNTSDFTFDDKAQKQVKLRLKFESVNGAYCITEVHSYMLGVDTTALVQLLPQLPYLRSFKSSWDAIYEPPGLLRQQPVPKQLASIAPASLEVFELSAINLCCTLPEEWGSWKTIVELRLGGNPLLTGSLPPWESMLSLKVLGLQNNGLMGTLPASYGSAVWAKTLQELDLSENHKLTGTIPGSWSSLSAIIRLDFTGVAGCVPDQLFNMVRPFNQFSGRCSQINNTELLALKALKGIVDKEGKVLTAWQDDPDEFYPDPLQGAPPGPPPYWCRKWSGVTCAQSNQVTGIDLSGLTRAGLNPTGLALNGPLLGALRQLPSLQVVNLSDCNIAGEIPAELSTLSSLRRLDLSSNPLLTGTLPMQLASLSLLEVLDISGCSITGTLPAAFAALQQLQVFRAANTSFSGQLPSSWGLLQSLQVLDISNALLTGTIPAAWFDSAARTAAAGAVLGALRAQPRAAAPSTALTARTKSLITLLPNATIGALKRAAASRSRQGAGVGLTQLKELRLAGNNLTGSIADGIEVLTALRVLDLSGNAVGGQLPNKLVVLTKLQELKMRNCGLLGALPASFARLTALTTLDLASNQITGTLPDVWVSLTHLRTMNLASNMLSGVLPLLWGALGGPEHSLELLVLTDNPCMEFAALNSSIQESGILSSGRVRVEVSGTATRGCKT